LPATKTRPSLKTRTFPDTGATITTTLTRNNWALARINVFVWNLLILVNAAIPVAAYAESFQHIPQQQEDGSWVWTYDVTVGDSTYTAELNASTNSEGLTWEMYLSNAESFTEFLWYSGQHDLLYTHGTWTLYKNPADPVELVGIEWHRSLTNSTADIKYINIEEGGDEYGGFIQYGITDDTSYDAFYDIFIASQERPIDIEWNLDSYIGHIRDEMTYEDTLWHCWDETLSDVACE